ncbi:MAG: DUF1549 domain-containing protein, partial [Verrucomicrobiota bacterium]
MIRALLGFCASTTFALAGSASEEPQLPSFPPDQLAFFENEIRPVLAENCYQCHAAKKAETGLRLDSRDAILRGSDYRKVIDLAEPAHSLLIKAVSHLDEKDVPRMPKGDEKLPEETILKLTRWIELGLPWPHEEVEIPDDPTSHWSFQPVTPPTLPEGVENPIDYLVRESQFNAGVAPGSPADRATRYRRAHFALLGLPPNYEEQTRFVNDPRPDEAVWPETIRKLMASPHYGERFARLWMDVARYSDTKGYEAGGRERRFVYSYTYRDWLIRAFNEDLPLDQFLIYQLAAEQIVDWKGPDKEHLAALGFISLSKNGRQELVVDDRLDTTFRGMMALTVACARCHDHKFDPISTREYYG